MKTLTTIIWLAGVAIFMGSAFFGKWTSGVRDGMESFGSFLWPVLPMEFQIAFIGGICAVVFYIIYSFSGK